MVSAGLGVDGKQKVCPTFCFQGGKKVVSRSPRILLLKLSIVYLLGTTDKITVRVQASGPCCTV